MFNRHFNFDVSERSPKEEVKTLSSKNAVTNIYVEYFFVMISIKVFKINRICITISIYLQIIKLVWHQDWFWPREFVYFYYMAKTLLEELHLEILQVVCSNSVILSSKFVRNNNIIYTLYEIYFLSLLFVYSNSIHYRWLWWIWKWLWNNVYWSLYLRGQYWG